MGQGIFYCNTCGLQILESDFKRGRAAIVLSKNYCKNCMKAAIEKNQGQQTPPQESAMAKTSSIPRKNPPTVRGLARQEEPSRKRPGDTGRIPKITKSGFLPSDPTARIIFLVGAALLVLAAVVIIVLMSKSDGSR